MYLNSYSHNKLKTRPSMCRRPSENELVLKSKPHAPDSSGILRQRYFSNLVGDVANSRQRRMKMIYKHPKFSVFPYKKIAVISVFLSKYDLFSSRSSCPIIASHYLNKIQKTRFFFAFQQN